MELLHGLLGIDIRELQEFARTFNRSGINSIDAFLMMRPEFKDLGRLAIAVNICMREDSRNVDEADDEGNWYRLLWNRMIAGVRNAEQIEQNRIRFVTFNYDRSLEFFLFDRCKNAFGLNDEQSLAVSMHFPVLHVYGLVGKFHYVGHEQNGTRAYSSSINAPVLRIASGGIRLIPEERGDSQVFMTARNWFGESERVCFLGFGFDPTNCENLGLSDVLDARGENRPVVVATTKGLVGAEVEEARRRTCGNHNWVHLDTDSVVALRTTGVLE